MKKAILSLFLLLTLAIAGLAQTDKPMLFRQPTLSKTHIVFVFAGDLWIVGREGGEASRLTTGVGVESSPLFSPDGSMVAFTGEYDGNIDVYVVPTTGGVPRRLTYHPGNDGVVGWTPDGKNVLFVSGRTSESGRTGQLFTMSVDGVSPTVVPLPMAYEGAYSTDGQRLAYVPLPRAFQNWKRYRGGRATPVWIADLKDSSIEKIPRVDSNDFNPMWTGNKVYFLSDRNGAVTLFAYDTTTRRVNQVLQNTGYDIKAASLGADAIIYEQFGVINLFDLKSGKTQKVNITLNGDLPSVRARYEKIGNRMFNYGISPTGARAVFEARGDILSVPAEKGNARNLTNTPGVAERDPSWSPDGKWVAYFSDESGEYALHLREQSGIGEVKKIALDPSFYYSPTWSPDSKKIAFYDKRLNLWYVDLAKGTPTKVDTTHAGAGTFDPAWSPDSRWLAYNKANKSWIRAVHVYSIEESKSYQVTDGMSDARFPTFDKSGKYLYFTASTDTVNTTAGLDMSAYPFRPTRSVYVCVLKKDLPSPLAPESDEEKVSEEKPAEAPKPPAKPEPVKVAIDFEGIGQRILALPIPNRTYVGMAAGKPNNLFIIEAATAPGTQGGILHKFDLEKRKLDKVIEGINAFDLSANGEKVLYVQGQNWFIASTMTPIKPGEGRIRTDEMEVYIDPKSEWTQMYKEVWRMERDFFYAPNYHGLDLKAAEKKYEPYLAALAHRADLNYLFSDMLGELSVGHLYIQGGDVPRPGFVPGGLLGADYKIENGRYRFAKIYNGENWNPQTRAPLTQPGVNVKEGEYLLAVNGRNLTATDNLYQFFESTANKQVVIKIGANPDGSASREVTVVPVANEGGLRNLAWIEGNRRKVEQMSGGKLAYVWLPDTAGGGYSNFNRYYFAQLDKDGAVIDERFNGGGSAADYIVDFLRKQVMSYWAVREGGEATTPHGVIPGPKVMIVNEYAGSGGDLMPWMFRRMKIGPLIGKRTWGGLVGIGGYPALVDGGSVTAPHFAFYNPESQWEVENHGVAPDIEVEMDPRAWREGKDPQLEKAVEVAMAALKRNPVVRPKRPAYPNYHNKPVAAPMTPAGGASSGRNN
ncbi:MAG: PDZ domain-containing protein [Acidobacteriota bacterium]